MPEATVLMIDDDEDFTASIRAVLEAEGYAVVSATSGREGLKKFDEVKPDLVLLDVMMESTTEGYAVAGALKNAATPVPIIMLSSVQESPADLFSRSGELEMMSPDAYFTKPVDLSKLLETVRSLDRRVKTA